MKTVRTLGIGGLNWVLAATMVMVLIGPVRAWAADGVVTVTIPVGQYVAAEKDGAQEIRIEGYGSLLVPGKPKLPSRIFPVAIPPNAEVVSVEVRHGQGLELDGTFELAPAPLPRVAGRPDAAIEARRQAQYDENYHAVYDYDDAYPAVVGEMVRTAGYRRYNLVDVRVTPVTYQPQSGKVIYYPDVTIDVHYRLVEGGREVMIDHQPRAERVARDLILNYDRAQDWYPAVETGTRGIFDYVVITIDSLTSAIQPLVDWEMAKGRSVQVVTVSWIDANYTGYDQAERIRRFLRDKYPTSDWGIDDVLIVGHYDDVPMRRTAQDLGYGEPETDFYYAELSAPDDASWDSNGNQQWGEYSDAVDFYNEVNVGRIPWSDAATVTSICNKSVAYEQNTDPSFKRNMLLAAAFFWNDDPNPRTDNAELMEAKIDQSWMADWTFTRLYEKNSTCYSTFPCDLELTHSNVVSTWSSGQYAFVNWAGHGSPTSSHIYGLGSAAFIQSSDCDSLNDSYPAIIFADACSNSDTDYTNIGQSMLRRGAVGFVGATKVALGCPGWNSPDDGSSQSMDYYFTTAVTSGNYTQGEAHQYALRQMYLQGLWGDVYYETFEWGALWGNPNLGMSDVATLRIEFPDGVPETLTPGVATPISIRIVEENDTLVPGSARLNYRFDGGSWDWVAVTSVGGDLYEGVLPPATCADTPEFFMMAAGDSSGLIFSPVNAPDTVYSAAVGEIVTVFDDPFESDLGWQAFNLGATAGDWQRGVPVDDPNWDYAPAACADGTGQCWLTENENNPAYTNPWNTDVDDGAVQLVSPVLDLAGGQVALEYDYYLRLTRPEDNNDVLLVELSSAGDAGPWTQIARHSTDGGRSWRHHVITQADLDAAGVTLSDNVKIRFTANDADDQSVVEAGVDNLLITGQQCSVDPGDGDFDEDGDVDLDDFAAFQACFGNGSIPAGCEPGDLNGDLGLDLDDFGLFAAGCDGPN